MTTIEELKKVMIDHGLTQHDVVLGTGCQLGSLSAWLLNKRKPGAAWEKLLRQYIEKIKEDY